MRVCIGSYLCENKTLMSYVHQCIIICWIKTPPFIGYGGNICKKIRVNYYSTKLESYLYLPSLKNSSMIISKPSQLWASWPVFFDRVGQLMVDSSISLYRIQES
jgi:hypothetical protein